MVTMIKQSGAPGKKALTYKRLGKTVHISYVIRIMQSNWLLPDTKKPE